MRRIDEIILHCSATPPSMDIGAAEVRVWHTAPPPMGNGWKDIGYHYVIRRSGEIETGRDIATIGAHCRGRNRHSLGVCLVGGVNGRGDADCNFTRWQYEALDILTTELKLEFAGVRITGHRDYAEKACPSFDVGAYFDEMGFG